MQSLYLPLDTTLNVLGLALAVGSLLIAEGITKRKFFIILACVVLMFLGTAVWLGYQTAQERTRHDEAIALERTRREEAIADVEKELKNVLAGNLWTQEQISHAMREPNFELLSQALARAIKTERVGQKATPCRLNEGTQLETRVYYNK